MSGDYRLVSSLREAFPAAARVLMVVAIGATLGGCSFAIPSLTPNAPEETTGSISPAPTSQKLFAELGPEETRRSRAALAVALDPQGNGKPVKWDNPESAMSGEITPEGAPFVEADEICRTFTASLATDTKSRRVLGKACRFSADEWLLRDLRPKKS
jgi:surface antigen